MPRDIIRKRSGHNVDEVKEMSEQTIQEVLEAWRGKTILVIKEELDNVDQAYLNLEEIRVKNIERDTDDYMANRFLELIGGGETVEETGEAALPYDQYDIPVSQLSAVHTENGQLKFKNDRASYTVYPV
jgi:hypothetical protein